jgi:hemolysin III
MAEPARGIGEPEPTPSPPAWRGLVHQAAFVVAIPAGVALVAVARGASARVGAVVYALSLIGMFGTSAAYHRIARSERSRDWLKRIDHSMIFILIAGTATPVALLGLQPPWSIVFMVIVWAGAAAGVALKMLRVERFDPLAGALYIALGWAAALLAPQLVVGLNIASLMLVIVGGLLYTLGAVVLLRGRPDPAPATFGYHEIWHSMVAAASACHYVAVLLIVLLARPPTG